MVSEKQIKTAVDAIKNGELVVYPTETVYGLGGDALNPTAINRVFDAKQRPPDKPLSIAVPNLETAYRFIRVTDRTRAFMEEFLPGPVTIVSPITEELPSELTGGEPTIGLRIPDHGIALQVLNEVAPITATSANVTGGYNVRHPDHLDATLLNHVSVVLGEETTPGGESSVVNPERGTIHRRGKLINEIEDWFLDHETRWTGR